MDDSPVPPDAPGRIMGLFDLTVKPPAGWKGSDKPSVPVNPHAED